MTTYEKVNFLKRSIADANCFHIIAIKRKINVQMIYTNVLKTLLSTLYAISYDTLILIIYTTKIAENHINKCITNFAIT